MEKSPEAFRTIREVAEAMDLPQHVLRFWESRFPQIRPMKRAGGRRYYRPDDVERLRLVKRLLYDEGYTIKGVQKLFKEQGAQSPPGGAAAQFGSSQAETIRNEEDSVLDFSAATGSGERAERGGIVADNQARRAAGEAELAALRQALADIKEAARILSRARSSNS